jgi:hypothetical protein
MKRILSLLIVAGMMAACGDDSGGGGSPTEPQVLSIAGTWTFSDNMSNAASGISCTATGTVTISQSGTNFTGSVTATTGVCTDSFGNAIDNTGTQSLTGGQISGNSVSFQLPFCQYNGTVSGNPANAMSGTQTCTLDVGGISYQFTGTWQGSR